MKNKLILIIISIVLISSYYLYGSSISPINALPKELVEHVQESFWEAGFLPDYTYCLKVKADKKQFIEFTSKLELTKNTLLKKYPQTCNNKMQNATWWSPPNIKDSELIFKNSKTTKEMGELAIFKDGILYFIAWNS